MNPYLDDPLYRELIPRRPSPRVKAEDSTPGWVHLKALAQALDDIPVQRDEEAC